MNPKLANDYRLTQIKMAEVEQKITEATIQLQTQLTSLRERDAKVRASIKEAMEKHNVKKYEGNGIVITYVSPTKRKSIDTALLKVEAPGIYDKYLKESDVAGSIRIKVL